MVEYIISGKKHSKQHLYYEKLYTFFTKINSYFALLIALVQLELKLACWLHLYMHGKHLNSCNVQLWMNFEQQKPQSVMYPKLPPRGYIFKICACRSLKMHSLTLPALRFLCKTFFKLLKFTLQNTLPHLMTWSRFVKKSRRKSEHFYDLLCILNKQKYFRRFLLLFRRLFVTLFFSSVWFLWSLLQHIFCWNTTEKIKPEKCYLGNRVWRPKLAYWSPKWPLSLIVYFFTNILVNQCYISCWAKQLYCLILQH